MGAIDKMLALEGLPFHITEAEVLSWLLSYFDCQISPTNITLMKGLDGRPSGRAVLDMGGHDTAVAALKALACNVWSPGGRTLVYETEYAITERLVLVRPLRRQERIALGA